MLSLMATVEEVRGVPYLLMRRRHSLWVISFAWEEGRAEGEEVAVGGAVCASAKSKMSLALVFVPLV